MQQRNRLNYFCYALFFLILFFNKLDQYDIFLIILDMSWNSEDFFDPSAYNQQYTGPTSYEFQQQHTSSYSKHTQYSNGNFIPSPYNINPQGQS